MGAGFPVEVPALTLNRVCGSGTKVAGLFDDETAIVEVPGRKAPTPFTMDEHNLPETNVESLAKLRLVFRKDGTITAGNAPGLNSAAAAMRVAERARAESCGLSRWRDWSPGGSPVSSR